MMLLPKKLNFSRIATFLAEIKILAINHKKNMNHYEIVFLVHPDQKSESEAILNKYCDQIKSSNGTIDRSENIGSRKLAYPIQDCFKANYFCINVTCDSDQIDSLKESFKYNDAILRHLIVRKDEIETEPSSLLKQMWS